MKLKKFSAIAISCIMAGAILTGCGDVQSTKDTAETRIGMISKLNASEESVNQHLKKLEEATRRPNMKLSHDYHYYDRMNDLIMSLNANQIDEISTYKSVANFIVSKNSELELLDHTINMIDSFCCAVRKEDAALRDDLNSAIKSMKDDGTLENLVKTYITDPKAYEEPVTVEMPQIDGAETLKVGVTGDLPPMDLILANGTPAGFNTAVLAEVGKRINKNIELVQIDSNARAAALTSKKIDIVFWVTIPGEFWYAEEAGAGVVPKDIDKPVGLDISDPYFEDEIVHVGFKK